jgi:thioredoxin 1
MKFGIRSIPTLIVFKGGKAVEQIIGAVPKGEIERVVGKAL